MTQLIPADYHGTAIQLIERDGVRWLTARDLGLCLGYAEGRAQAGIINLYNRHRDEFTAEDSTTIKLMTVDGKQRDTRIFSPGGCHLLSFFANTARAKDFRAWAKQVLATVSEAPAESRLEAHMAVLAQGMTALLAQNNLTHRYIALLEMNQRCKRRIKREDEAIVRQLHGEGMSQADIARLLRISATSVNRLLHGNYQFSDNPVGKGITELLEEALAREQAQLAATFSALPGSGEVQS